MRVAVIGCGSIGRRHIGNLLSLGCVVRAMDVSADARARVWSEYPSVSVADHAGLDVDAMLIATPADRHLSWVEDAVRRHRIPFFVEKPLGTLEQLESWRALVRHADGLTTQVGYNLRFHSKVQAMRQIVTAPTGGQFYLDCDMTTWPGAAYASPLLECSHELDLALSLGAPATVDDASIDGDEIDVWLGPIGQDWRIQIRHREGIDFRQWSLHDGGNAAHVVFGKPADLGDQMYRDELTHFLECVRSGKPTACPLGEGLRVLEVCQQVMERVKAA